MSEHQRIMRTTFLSKVGDWHTKAERWVSSYLVGVGVIVILVIVNIGIIGRYLFNYSLPSGIEITVVIWISISVLALSYVQYVGGHVEIEMLKEHLRPKARLLIQLIGLLALLLFALVVTWQGILYAMETWAYYIPGVIRIPTGPFRFFIPLGFALMSLRVIRQIIETSESLRKLGV